MEDNEIVRNGLFILLNAQAKMEVIGTAANGLEALKLLQNALTPDIILTDLNMPGMDGIELIKKATKINPRIRMIILTMHRQSTFLENALAAGAKGYLLKGEDFEDLFTGIRAVHSGETYVSPWLSA